jgi:inorganic triphosphatase YgiF
VEIALDLGVLRGGEKEIPLCEVEVELKSGSQDAAVAFAEALAEKYALVPEPKSKFARAAALSLE